MSAFHAHVGPVANEPRDAFRIDAEPIPVGAGDAHVGIQI
ncbi:hypothetical protein RAHE111665_16595 [Rariglobus hedericola]